MRVLGVDPGLGRTGVAIVDGRVSELTLVEATCIETIPHTDESLRLSSLLQQVEDFAREHKPDIAAIEELYFSTNRATAIAVAQARGVVLCALSRAGVASVSYTPNQVKEAVAGVGSARKPQVARMTCRHLGVAKISGPDDVADACAIAICHHHRAALRLSAPTRGGAGDTPLDRAIARAQAQLVAHS